MHGEIIIQNLQFQRIDITTMKITIIVFTQKIDGTVFVIIIKVICFSTGSKIFE